MRLIAVLGVLLVLASCSDSDMDANIDENLTYECYVQGNVLAFGTFKFDLDNNYVEVDWIHNIALYDISTFRITEISNDSITFQEKDFFLADLFDNNPPEKPNHWNTPTNEGGLSYFYNMTPEEREYDMKRFMEYIESPPPPTEEQIETYQYYQKLEEHNDKLKKHNFIIHLDRNKLFLTIEEIYANQEKYGPEKLTSFSYHQCREVDHDES